MKQETNTELYTHQVTEQILGKQLEKGNSWHA